MFFYDLRNGKYLSSINPGSSSTSNDKERLCCLRTSPGWTVRILESRNQNFIVFFHREEMKLTEIFSPACLTLPMLSILIAIVPQNQSCCSLADHSHLVFTATTAVYGHKTKINYLHRHWFIITMVFF